jgi:hypothetical protein
MEKESHECIGGKRVTSALEERESRVNLKKKKKLLGEWRKRATSALEERESRVNWRKESY